MEPEIKTEVKPEIKIESKPSTIILNKDNYDSIMFKPTIDIKNLQESYEMRVNYIRHFDVFVIEKKELNPILKNLLKPKIKTLTFNAIMK
jgi:hypothetical protein